MERGQISSKVVSVMKHALVLFALCYVIMTSRLHDVITETRNLRTPLRENRKFTETVLAETKPDD